MFSIPQFRSKRIGMPILIRVTAPSIQILWKIIIIEITERNLENWREFSFDKLTNHCILRCV